MDMELPKAEYHSQVDQVAHTFTIDPTASHTTNGKTTGSTLLDNENFVDKDKPSEAKDSTLGSLRAMVTTLQDDINVFLTDRMAQAGNVGELAKDEQEADDELNNADDEI